MARLMKLETLLKDKFDNHLSPGTIRNWCSTGVIPFVRIGSRVLFDEEEIDGWIAEHRQESVDLQSERRLRTKHQG